MNIKIKFSCGYGVSYKEQVIDFKHPLTEEEIQEEFIGWLIESAYGSYEIVDKIDEEE